MAKILLVKRLKALYPCDEAGEDVLRHLAQGEVIEVTFRKPRNVRFHRKFFALLSLVWEQVDDQEKYPTVEALLTEAKLITGHYERRDIEFEGKRYPVLTPKSISFAAMDDIAFGKFYDRVSDWVARDVLPGTSSPELQEEVERLIGARA
jgi:hypothetical protein